MNYVPWPGGLQFQPKPEMPKLDPAGAFAFAAAISSPASNAKDDEIVRLKSQLAECQKLSFRMESCWKSATSILIAAADAIALLRAENADLRARLAPHEPKPEPTMGEVLARSFR